MLDQFAFFAFYHFYKNMLSVRAHVFLLQLQEIDQIVFESPLNCRTFNWALSMGGKVPVAEGLEHADLPDGTGEFLDAWLMLVEKMVNPSTVLDSPHSLPAKMPGITPTIPQFSALRFLIVTQKVSI